MKFSPVRVTKEQADDFVFRVHRHHDPDQGHRFSLGCWDNARGVLCGVAVVGRPRAPGLDHRRGVEVTRCATDETKHACSWLYGIAAEHARLDGWAWIITYTLAEEGGASLRGAGWWGEELPKSTHTWANREGRDADHVLAGVRWLKLLGEHHEAPAVLKPTAQLQLLEACT